MKVLVIELFPLVHADGLAAERERVRARGTR